ncbi:hypothetical protein TB2_033997 [Malus domestica]
MSNIHEDLQTTLLQMLQRLENASTSFRKKADMMMGSTSPISLPLFGGKDDGKEERKKLKASQSDSPSIFLQNNQGQVKAMVDKCPDPFSEALVNMINLAWVEKGK